MSDDYATPSTAITPSAEPLEPAPAATPAHHGRAHLEAIDARCLAVSETLFICSDVKTRTGSAHAQDGLLMPVTDMDPTMECFRVLEPPDATFVCGVDRVAAQLELNKMPEHDALRRAVQGKIDLISPAQPRMGSQGPGTSELIR